MHRKDREEGAQETGQVSQGGTPGEMLTELYVKGNFTENREEWQKELQLHCEEVYTD